MEERAPHLEDQVRRALEGRRQAVWGKRLPGGARGFPEALGHGPGHRPGGARPARARPAGRLPGPAPRARARAAAERRAALARRALDVTPRTPTYCAGCPHRGTSSPMLEIRRRLADPALHEAGPRARAGRRDRPRRHRLLLDGLPAALRGDAQPVGDGPGRRDRRRRRARSSPTSTTCSSATAPSSTARCPRSRTRSSSARTSSSSSSTTRTRR